MSTERQDGPAADERLADWVDGRLPARELERFEAELRVNARLRADAAEYRRTVEAVRQALREPIARVDLADRVMTAIDDGAVPARPSLASFRLLPALLSVAAAAAILVTGLLLVRWDPDDRPATDATASVPVDLHRLSADEEAGITTALVDQDAGLRTAGERDRLEAAEGRTENSRAEKKLPENERPENERPENERNAEKSKVEPEVTFRARATQPADVPAGAVAGAPAPGSQPASDPAARGVPGAAGARETPGVQAEQLRKQMEQQPAKEEVARPGAAAQGGAGGSKEQLAVGAERGGQEAKRAGADAGVPIPAPEQERAAVGGKQDDKQSADGRRGQPAPVAPATAAPLPPAPTLPVVTLTRRLGDPAKQAPLPTAAPESVAQFHAFFVAGSEPQGPEIDPAKFPYFQQAGAPQLTSLARLPVQADGYASWLGFDAARAPAGGPPAVGEADGRARQDAQAVNKLVEQPGLGASVWLVEGSPEEIRRLLEHAGELARSEGFELHSSDIPADSLNLAVTGAASAAPGRASPQRKPAQPPAEPQVQDVRQAAKDKAVQDRAARSQAAVRQASDPVSSPLGQTAGASDRIRLLLVLRSLPKADPPPDAAKPVEAPRPRRQ